MTPKVIDTTHPNCLWTHLRILSSFYGLLRHFNSYDIFDKDSNTVHIVKSELSWGHRLQIYDAM